MEDKNDPPVFQCNNLFSNAYGGGLCKYNVHVDEQSEIYTNVGPELQYNVSDLDPKDSTFFSLSPIHMDVSEYQEGDGFQSGLFRDRNL